MIAASGGNAGLAVAYAAKSLDIPAEVYVPTTAPMVKVTKLGALGVAVVQHGTEYAEAYEVATKRAADTGALFCHAYDQPEVCAGQGSAALELLNQLGQVDTVVLAVGGGGNGVLFESTASGFRNDAPAGAGLIQGVFASDHGDWASGEVVR